MHSHLIRRGVQFSCVLFEYAVYSVWWQTCVSLTRRQATPPASTGFSVWWSAMYNMCVYNILNWRFNPCKCHVNILHSAETWRVQISCSRNRATKQMKWERKETRYAGNRMCDSCAEENLNTERKRSTACFRHTERRGKPACVHVCVSVVATCVAVDRNLI